MLHTVDGRPLCSMWYAPQWRCYATMSWSVRTPERLQGHMGGVSSHPGCTHQGTPDADRARNTSTTVPQGEAISLESLDDKDSLPYSRSFSQHKGGCWVAMIRAGAVPCWSVSRALDIGPAWPSTPSTGSCLGGTARPLTSSRLLALHNLFCSIALRRGTQSEFMNSAPSDDFGGNLVRVSGRLHS